MIVILNATINSSRDRLVIKKNTGETNLIQYVIDSTNHVFPETEITAITNDPGTYETIESFGIKSLLQRNINMESKWQWTDIIKTFLFRKMLLQDTVMVVSPSLGIITPGRIKEIYKQSLKDSSSVFISSRKLEANCSPAWLNVCAKDLSSNAVCNDELKLFNPSRYFRKDLARIFPDHEEIKGSQWLPDLYVADEAVVCCSESLLEGKNYSNHDLWKFVKWENGSLHPLHVYNMPVFQIDEEIISGFFPEQYAKSA